MQLNLADLISEERRGRYSCLKQEYLEIIVPCIGIFIFENQSKIELPTLFGENYNNKVVK